MNSTEKGLHDLLKATFEGSRAFCGEVVGDFHYILHEAQVNIEEEAEEGNIGCLHLYGHAGEVDELQHGPHFPVRLHRGPKFILQLRQTGLVTLQNGNHCVEGSHGDTSENRLSEEDITTNMAHCFCKSFNKDLLTH